MRSRFSWAFCFEEFGTVAIIIPSSLPFPTFLQALHKGSDVQTAAASKLGRSDSVRRARSDLLLRRSIFLVELRCFLHGKNRIRLRQPENPSLLRCRPQLHPDDPYADLRDDGLA